MALEKERATYEANRGRLIEHEGKWVVVQGDSVAGVWDTYDDALKAGYEQFGLTPFLVKQVFAVEPVYYFTQELPPCRS